MNALPSPVRRSTCVALLIAASLAMAGCASEDRPPRGDPGHAGRAQALPTLTARADYFAGRLTAEVRVGAMAGFHQAANGAPRGGGEGRHKRGGGVQMSGLVGGLKLGPGGGGPPPGGDDDAPRGGQRPARQSSAPPVAIHLRFSNTGTAPADLVIADFLSPLGNFVVHPSSLRLEPGQSLEVEPMASGLAGEVTSFAITLRLRLDGAEESKTLELAPEPAPPPADSPH